MTEPINQPEALRLADYMDAPLNDPKDVADPAAAELRRLHGEVERLRATGQAISGADPTDRYDGVNEMMTDQEAAAWTRGRAVGERELKAAEKRWQKERAVRIAQRNLWADEANEARAEIQRLRQRQLYWWALALALAVNAAWLIASWMEVV